MKARVCPRPRLPPGLYRGWSSTVLGLEMQFRSALAHMYLLKNYGALSLIFLNFLSTLWRTHINQLLSKQPTSAAGGHIYGNSLHGFLSDLPGNNATCHQEQFHKPAASKTHFLEMMSLRISWLLAPGPCLQPIFYITAQGHWGLVLVIFSKLFALLHFSDCFGHIWSLWKLKFHLQAVLCIELNS